MVDIKKNYNKAVQAYIDEFCKKHEVDFDFWIGDCIGEVCCIGDYYFDFNDIKLDIDANVPGDTIYEWYDYNCDQAYPVPVKKQRPINYRSWVKGLRPEDLK